MPELPEVETIRKGILPYSLNKRIKSFVIREHRLRFPIDASLLNAEGQKVKMIHRRGKYLVFELEYGWLLLHLGMSGRLHIRSSQVEPAKHDHFDILFEDEHFLRFSDPRRFGFIIWTNLTDIQHHPRLSHLGPEPLSHEFTRDSLYSKLKISKSPIKQRIMDARVVVGVGNIYANEALFQAKIHPNRSSNSLTLNETASLVKSIQNVLQRAIAKGGTTLKDFENAEGKPGYFQQELWVYGRENQDCFRCHHPLDSLRLANRATVFCPSCQSS